jgi:tRNA-dihydrouridine synthase
MARHREQRRVRPQAVLIVTGRVGSEDASEILIEGGQVGIVVGRAASQNLWPRVGAWLSEHD